VESLSEFVVKQTILSIAENILEQKEMSAVFETIKTYKTNRFEGVRAFLKLDKLLFIPSRDPMFNQQKNGSVDILKRNQTEESWDLLQNALIYCRYFVTNTDLTQTSRDFIRRSCDYVENCAKYLLSSLEPNAPLNYPLGNIINALKRKDFNLPANLIVQVEAFNKEIYTRAKHKYDLPPGEHLYSPDEAFLIYFVAKKIGSKIRELVVLPK
jgi:hypothetical protein